MTDNKQSLHKSLEDIDQLYDVMVDAYRRGVVLNYCLKCFTIFLTSEEEKAHDEIHKTHSNSVYTQNHNNPNKSMLDTQYNNSAFQEKTKSFVKTNHSNNITKCYVCCKQFSLNVTKLVHLQTHLYVHVSKCTTGFVKVIDVGKQLFKCNKCEKGFAQSYNLPRHQRTHTGERPYESSLCKKAVFQPHHLSVQKRTHTGEKPYKSPLTNIYFAFDSFLRVCLQVDFYDNFLSNLLC